ncbi:amidohydrolase family protein [Bacillus cereus]|uniref:N-acetylglucosamine-6-phosphate deacetylase n=1 Tax=Bacillus cereus TaxID=1396 RepID=UPI00356CA477
MEQFVFADRFFLEDGVAGPGYLEIKEGKFGSFLVTLPTESAYFINYEGKWIAPGLVDTHIHGFKNHDIIANDLEVLKAISEGLLSCGVTSFLPTTLTSSPEMLNEVVKMIWENYTKVRGAKIKGIFLEGPFFTEKHRGAQNTKYFCDPSVEMLETWQKHLNHFIKKIALAPERKGAMEFIEHAVNDQVMVALAHSDAAYIEAKHAVEKGTSIFVHTFNGMSGLHHHEPGMIGAAMNLPEGLYQLGEFPVEVKNGAVRLETESLADSILQLKEVVKNVVDWGIATPEEAFYMASTAPAKSISIDGECGMIATGYDADFIVLTPELELTATYLDGVCRFQTENLIGKEGVQ